MVALFKVQVFVRTPVVEMGKHCFYNCEELENVTIGASLHAEDGEIILNNEAFWYCSNLSEAFINGHSVTIGKRQMRIL